MSSCYRRNPTPIACTCVIVTVHESVVAVHAAGAFVHPVNRLPPVGVAVSVTLEPIA